MSHLQPHSGGNPFPRYGLAALVAVALLLLATSVAQGHANNRMLARLGARTATLQLQVDALTAQLQPGWEGPRGDAGMPGHNRQPAAGRSTGGTLPLPLPLPSPTLLPLPLPSPTLLPLPIPSPTLPLPLPSPTITVLPLPSLPPLPVPSCWPLGKCDL